MAIIAEFGYAPELRGVNTNEPVASPRRNFFDETDVDPETRYTSKRDEERKREGPSDWLKTFFFSQREKQSSVGLE